MNKMNRGELIAKLDMTIEEVKYHIKYAEYGVCAIYMEILADKFEELANIQAGKIMKELEERYEEPKRNDKWYNRLFRRT